MTRTGRILSRGSRVCCRRWMRMQSAGIDLSAVIAAACRYLGIEEKELARRFNVDRSAHQPGDPKGKPRPGTACSHQNDTKRTRTRKKSTLKQRPVHPSGSADPGRTRSSKSLCSETVSKQAKCIDANAAAPNVLPTSLINLMLKLIWPPVKKRSNFKSPQPSCAIGVGQPGRAMSLSPHFHGKLGPESVTANQY